VLFGGSLIWLNYDQADREARRAPNSRSSSVQGDGTGSKILQSQHRLADLSLAKALLQDG
jgi:hypothetical protein